MCDVPKRRNDEMTYEEYEVSVSSVAARLLLTFRSMHVMPQPSKVDVCKQHLALVLEVVSFPSSLFVVCLLSFLSFLSFFLFICLTNTHLSLFPSLLHHYRQPTDHKRNNNPSLDKTKSILVLLPTCTAIYIRASHNIYRHAPQQFPPRPYRH